MERYYDFFQTFLRSEEKMLLVRGPSPSHFDTNDGILENLTHHEAVLESSNTEYPCVPLRRVPSIVQRQEEGLRILVNRLKQSNSSAATSTVDYLDVYNLTRDRYMEHRDPHTHNDCKHYCQHCGTLRAWNSLVADFITTRFVP